MPFLGMSKNITKKNWSLNDCVVMLHEILDELKIDKVIADGHNWGSITILRAANKYLDCSLALGQCNMPLKGTTKHPEKTIDKIINRKIVSYYVA